jgi:hypothetical protein
VDGTCHATWTGLDEVLLEVTVPASAASRYSGGRYFVTWSNLSSKGGEADIVLPELVELRGAVFPPPCQAADGEWVSRESTGLCPQGSLPALERPCAQYDFGAVPAELTFTPEARASGVATTTYKAITTCSDKGCGTGQFAVTLPRGKYRVYVRPTAEAPQDGSICPVTPELRDYEVKDEPHWLFHLTPPAWFSAVVKWPEANGDERLRDWTLELLDPDTGLRISTESVLQAGLVREGRREFSARVAYVPAVHAGNELVRLRPPAGVVAPNLVMERAALELFTGEVEIGYLTSLPEPVNVEGRALANLPDNPPVASTITFVATELAPTLSGIPASFEATVQADENGLFHARLLPGTYRVRVVPPASCPAVYRCADALCDCPLAPTEVEGWLVADAPSFQGGKSLLLEERPRVSGVARTSTDVPLAGAAVNAVAPVPSMQAMDVALGRLGFVPRATAGVVNPDGSFKFLADPGVYDLSVRPDAESGFPWLVRAGLTVEPATDTDVDLPMPLPVSYRGRVLAEGKAVDGAIIRVFASVEDTTPDGARATRRLQVAESRASESGAGGSGSGDAAASSRATGYFELLLPSHMEGPAASK